MKNKTRKILVIFILILTVMGAKTFADNIGHIDMQVILQNYELAKKADTEFKEKQKEYQKVLEEKQKELDEKRKNGANEEELEEYKAKIQEELKPQQEELLRLQQKLTTNIQTSIIKAAEKVAKEYGIDVIVHKQAIVVGSFDLTEFVLTELKK